MADQKISELPKLVSVPADDVWLVVVHDGQNKRIALATILAAAK